MSPLKTTAFNVKDCHHINEKMHMAKKINAPEIFCMMKPELAPSSN